MRRCDPRQQFNHLVRHGKEQFLPGAVPQHLSDVLDDVPWELWCALVRPSAWPLVFIGPHRLLSIAVPRPLCQLMQPNSRRKVVVSGVACGKCCSPRNVLTYGLTPIQGARQATSKGLDREQHPPPAYCMPGRNPGAKARSTSSIRRAVSSSGLRCLWQL